MANPKQYIVTPNPDITSRDNVESVSSEGGAHVGPAYPSSDNEGAMVPFQETYGTFTETDIDYRLVKSGGIGSAEWVWKKKGESDTAWKGVGDIRNQTNHHNPFKQFEGKAEVANLGISATVSKAHNRLLLTKRTHASNDYGAIHIATRPLDVDNITLPENWKVKEFKPKTYFDDVDVNANMWHVAMCELDDGSLRMIGSDYDVDTKLWDLHLFGSNDGGDTWEVLQQNIIARWYNQNDKLLFPYEVRRLNNVKMSASGSWIRIVWVGPYDKKFHTLVSSDRGATWENPAPPPYFFMYLPFLHQDAWHDYDPTSMVTGTGRAGPAHGGWYPWSVHRYESKVHKLDTALMSGGAEVAAFYNVAQQPNTKPYPVGDVYSTDNPGTCDYFDLVPIGGSEGSFALVFQARPNTLSSALGGSDPTRCTYICGGVREAPWGIARLIASPDYIKGALDTGGSSVEIEQNANQQRPFQQFCFTDTSVSAVATPSWLYIFIFATPGQTGGTTQAAGWSPYPDVNADNDIAEPFGNRRGFGGYDELARVAAAPGPWGFTAQKCGWKGYRIPMNDPFGGVAQKLHVSDINGHLFPAAVGQGKMFVPSNVVMEWDGQRIICFNGIGHNGALDAYMNGMNELASGPQASVSHFGDPVTRSNQLVRYGWSYYRNYWQDEYGYEYGRCRVVDVTDSEGSHDPINKRFTKAFKSYHSSAGLSYSADAALYGIAVVKGRGRRASFFDAPLTFAANKSDPTEYLANQEFKGRSHCVVSTFGGWDTQPISEPNGLSIGNLECAPYFADTWSAQYGIPHYNFIGASWTGSTSTEIGHALTISPRKGWKHQWDRESAIRTSATYAAGMGEAPASTVRQPNGSTLMGFNIIGDATPGPLDDDGNTYVAAFIDTAQAPAFGCDTALLCNNPWDMRTQFDNFQVVSASQWTVRCNRKYLQYRGGISSTVDQADFFDGATHKNKSCSWPWDRFSRDLGDRTVDWESDRVTIRQNFSNKRTGQVGNNRDNMPIAFTTWRSGMGYWEMIREYMGNPCTIGFSDSVYPVLPGSLWGTSPYMNLTPGSETGFSVNHRIANSLRFKGYNKDTFSDEMVPDLFDSTDQMRYFLEQGRPIPLGNGGIIEFVVSVPHKGLRGSDSNPNRPEKHVTSASGNFGKAGNWRLAAVSCRYYTESSGFNTGSTLGTSEFCVAIGQSASGNSDVAVLVDQLYWDLQDSGVSRKDPIHLATIDLGQEAMGTVDNPRFWKFRVVLFRESATKRKIKLLAREYGDTGKWLDSGVHDMRMEYMDSTSKTLTQHEYKWGTSYGGNGAGYSNYEMQMCQWGKLDEQVTDSAYLGKYLSSDSYQNGSGGSGGTQVADKEYVSYWKEFNVSHPGTGGVWRQSDFKNPESLTGMVCSPIPVYVCTGIYARWGGGGGFVGDTFSGTIDHTFAVENIFKPSPSSKWKSADSVGAGAKGTSPECSIVMSVYGSESTSSRNLIRTYANWVAFYGTQDRKFIVDFSRDGTFTDPKKIISYEANSLITEGAVLSTTPQANTFQLTDPNHNIKDGELAGMFASWAYYDEGGAFTSGGYCYATIRIKTNVRNDDEGTVVIFADTEDPDTRAVIGFPRTSLYGKGLRSGSSVDIWSDRSAINLYSSTHLRALPEGYADPEAFLDEGFSWMRLRFFKTDSTTNVGSTAYRIEPGYWTIDKQRTLGSMVMGHGTEFEVPINWTYTETTTPNVKTKVSPSGRKTSYEQGPSRKSLSLDIPGDASDFRYKLSNLLRNNAGFTKKPVALLLSTEADVPNDELDTAIRASSRYNILARLTGAISNRNVGWVKDSRGVWHPAGDLSLTFEEEI